MHSFPGNFEMLGLWYWYFNQSIVYLFLVTLVLNKETLSDPASMQFSHNIEQFPHDGETTMRQNIVLTIFNTQNIYHHVWKTFRTTLQSNIGLQSQGEGHEWRKTLGQICSIVFLAL